MVIFYAIALLLHINPNNKKLDFTWNLTWILKYTWITCSNLYCVRDSLDKSKWTELLSRTERTKYTYISKRHISVFYSAKTQMHVIFFHKMFWFGIIWNQTIKKAKKYLVSHVLIYLIQMPWRSVLRVLATYVTSLVSIMALLISHLWVNLTC